MHKTGQLLEAVRAFLKIKMVKIGFIILAVVFLCLGILECWLNIKVRKDLRQSLGWGSGPQVKIEAHLNWLTMVDVFKGRVSHVRIDAHNCLISNLRFAELHLSNEGFTFNFPVLFRKHRLELIHLNSTRIQALVTAADFSDYVGLFYPEFKPQLTIIPGEIIFSGRARLFGQPLPIELGGFMKIVPPKSLRFYPTQLRISGRTAPPDLLNFLGAQFPLQFQLLGKWPFALTSIDLGNGSAVLNLKENNAGN